MQITSKIFKVEKGKLRGRWKLRIRFRDEDSGRWIDAVQRTYQTRTEAADARPIEERKIRKTEGRAMKGDKMTFSDLAEYAAETFYRPAVIKHGRKIAGIKSHRQTHSLIRTLVNHFGPRKIANIRKADLETYKAARADEVSITTVNRELATMRKMLNEAKAEGWIIRNPFDGAHIIDIEAEKTRTRRLTIDEERRLFHFAHGKFEFAYTKMIKGKVRQVDVVVDHNAPYLRAAMLLAIDGAMRKGEILKLDWKDIDLEKNLIRIRSTNTKTQRERLAPLTDRAKAELLQLESFAGQGRIFPVKDFRRVFDTTKRLAGISDLHFHDLRTHAITGMQLKGIAQGVAGKLAGHSQISTTNRYYTTTDEEIVSAVRDVLNSHHEPAVKTESEAIN